MMHDEQRQFSDEEFEDIKRGTQEEFRILEAERPKTLQEKADTMFIEVKEAVRDIWSDVSVHGSFDIRRPSVNPHERVEDEGVLHITIGVDDENPDRASILDAAKTALGGVASDDRFVIASVEWDAQPRALIGKIRFHPIPSFPQGV